MNSRCLGSDALGGFEQLVPGAQLDARAAQLLAGSSLELVDRGPAGIQDRSRPTFGEQGLDRVRRDVLAMNHLSLLDVLEQFGHRLRRILLVRPDDPRRPALDPARAIGSEQRLPGLVVDAAAVVANRSAALIERKVRKPDTAIADAAKDEPAFERLVLVGRNGNETAVLVLEPVVHELDGLEARGAVQRHGRHEEAKADHDWLAGRLALCKAAQDFEVPP